MYVLRYSTTTPPPTIQVDLTPEQTHCELDHEGGVCGRRLTAIRRRCPLHGDGFPVLTDDRTEDLWPQGWRHV